MESLLAQLSRQLLHSADPGLLDLRLDSLSERLDDDEVRELLTALHEAGEGDRLRDVLIDDRLSRWVVASCTAREEEALCAQLQSWLGSHAAGPDDPARLPQLSALPHDAAGLWAWAEQYGVTHTLQQPAHELLSHRAALAPDATLADVCLARGARVHGASLLAGQLEHEARAYLRALAADAEALSARAALHGRPLPDGPLGLLAQRLRAVFAGTALHELQPLRFVPARPVDVDVATGVASGSLRAAEGEPPTRVTLYLSGFPQRALEGKCTACSALGCLHVRALAARLFDACLLEGDRLRPALAAFASVPPWRRFLDAQTARTAPAPPEADRLCFSIRLEREQALVGVLLQRAGAGERGTPGRLVSAHKMARSPHASDRDQSVLAALSARTRTLSAQYIAADLMVLRALVEHPHVQLDGVGPLRVVEETVEVDLIEQPEGLAPRVRLAGASIAGAPRALGARYVLRHDRSAGTLCFAALTPALERLLAALEHFRGLLPPESYPYVAPWLASLREVARVALPRALVGLERPPPERLLLRISPRFDQGVDASLLVRALPLAPLWTPGQGPELVHGLVDGVHSSVRRALERERALAAELVQTLGLTAHPELGASAYRIDSTQAALEVLSRAARLHDRLEIEWAEQARAHRITATVRAADLTIRLFKRGEWCALEGGAQDGALRVAVDRLLDAARMGERFVPIGGSDYLELEEELFERLRQAQLCTFRVDRELLLPTAAAPLWLDTLGSQTLAGDEASAAWLASAREHAIEPPVPIEPSLASVLRGYQLRGVRWLLQRSRWSPGVCLADEMGLGKTVQTIALLMARAERGPALVLAPTSVVSGWLAELARFAPALKACSYRGAKREQRLAELGPGSVLVASYDLLLRDRARFEPLAFATLVLDEAQLIKNARTLRAHAVASVRAEFRVALSGTPIENRLGDLWSLFHLITPGLLGSWQRFRARFAVPIERYENEQRATTLRALVAPFLLRRTKREVAAELPPRTEVLRLVELSPAERELYTAAVAHARRALGRRRKHDSAHTVQLLAELTRLRQLACHPRLVLHDARVSSSKLTALLQLLDDILPRGHRVLLFSQFVRYLDLVEEALSARALACCRLDGSTPAGERARVIERFQRGDTPIFLISLKAGGTGLNLTAADYVVHLDPWWNPSAEDQASDRAHRLGQDRPVTIVKLVAQDTIEERVLGLHEHKRRLADSVIRSGGDGELDVAALERLLAE